MRSAFLEAHVHVREVWIQRKMSSVRMEKIVRSEWILDRQATVASIQPERQNK